MAKRGNCSTYELHLLSPAIKSLWLCRNQLHLKHGVLFYSWIDRIDDKLVLVIPKTLQEEVWHFCHDTITAGHLGADKTLLREKPSFLWYGMIRDVKLYINSCRVCYINKKPNVKPKDNLKLYHAGFSMERVHIDLLGPFMISSLGNKHILMMIDQFTKWLECAPIPNQNTETVVQNFLAHSVVSSGCPLEVHTDQDKQFDGNLFKAFCDLPKITKTWTMPYHPASNGQVEHYNCLILQIIHCFIGKYAKDWDNYLTMLVMATIPFDLIMGMVDAQQHYYDPVKWVKMKSEVIPKMYDLVRKNLSGMLKYRKRDYNLTLVEKGYDIGDYVYKIAFTTKPGAKALFPIQKGPFMVVESSHPLYKIEDCKGRQTTIHHDWLKVCTE